MQRRRGLELTDVWEELRRNIDDAPAHLRVVVRVRSSVLGRFLRLHQADLAGPPPAGARGEGDSEWVELELRFRELGAARPLLAFGTRVEVVSPPELREELAGVATDIAALYRT
ncbi:MULTISPECIES: WYL domain-containing protein [Streptomyces]|uniref:WYL domain-containing protein n=1 Tax=Streptomyces TaxID=1883 RepID=UPI001EE64904|nr:MULTISPECIES: WYL domain-containing protein [Streptomyces]